MNLDRLHNKEVPLEDNLGIVTRSALTCVLPSLFQCPDLKHVVVMKSQLRAEFDASTMREGVMVQTFDSVMNLRIFR